MGRASLAVALLFAAALLAAQVGTERTIRREIGVGSTRLQEVSYQLRRAETARQTMEREVTAVSAGLILPAYRGALPQRPSRTLLSKP